MIEELQIINHWLESKDPAFIRKIGIDSSYFFATSDIVNWVDGFQRQTGKLPSPETVAAEFDDFRKLSDLEPVPYLVGVLSESKAYTEYRPILSASAKLLNEGKTLEAIWKMKADTDALLKRYTTKITQYDWVKDAEARFERYMEKHGLEGLRGLTSGIKGLDDLTGGWRDDDMILLAARTNEGKSLMANYFGYAAWRSLQIARMNDPIIHITTEMPEIEVAYRLDTLRAHFSNRGLNDGKLADPSLYKEYLEQLARADGSYKILSQEANGGKQFTPTDIRAIIESEKPAFVIIDQLYDLSDGTNERDIRKKIVNITTQLREVNLATRTPTLLIAQAGRDSAKEAHKDNNVTPELHQIQESDNPAQKATRVLTIRLIDDVFKLSLKKNRGGVKNVDVYMRANIDNGIWEESSPEELVF